MPVLLSDARATRDSRVLLRRLFPLYVHDLSPHTNFYSIDGRGRWNPELCRDWLLNPDIEPYLIHNEGQVAGFAIVGRAPFPLMSPDRELKVCEFFVLASARRTGVGSSAAAALFDGHRGLWELGILPTNERAQGFWRSVLNGYTGGCFEEIQLPADIQMRFSNR